MNNKKLKLEEEKKPYQLKLSSMSENYTPIVRGRSAKNHSQLMQYIKKKARQAEKNKEK